MKLIKKKPIDMNPIKKANGQDGQRIEAKQKKFTMPPVDGQSLVHPLSDKISSFKGINPVPITVENTWKNALEEIRAGKHKGRIERGRKILATEGKEKYTEFKKFLPGVTFGGVFKHREKNGIIVPTGFIVPDIDHVDVGQVKEVLSGDENIWFCFVSPGGDGIKCGLRAENISTDGDHKKLYLAVERYFKENYDIEIDPACKDISRLTFLSHDPDAYINNDPSYFNIAAWEKEPPKIEVPEIVHTENGTGKKTYAYKVLESACLKIRESTPGKMHRTRLTMSRLVGGYLHYIDEAEALRALELAVEESRTVNFENAMKTVRAGIEHGKRSPIEIPDVIPQNDLKQEISALSKLDIIDREKERNRISEQYNIRKSVIDQFLKILEEKNNDGGTTEIVSSAIPWESSVDGLELISDINKLLQRHIILPDGSSEAISIWVLLTYCFGVFRILPILGIISPEKRCGKTTLLETLHALCNRALLASNVSPAAVFRTIEKYKPTLLIDEADTFLRDNEELRGVLNSGHTKSAAFVIRIQGDNHEPVRFSTWGPKAIAMIGKLPDTLYDRSVVVSLRRKIPGESVERIGVDFENACFEIRSRCQRWSDDNIYKLRDSKPQIPQTGNDRACDNWLPLLAIAETIGGQWPETIRGCMTGSNPDEGTISCKLLSDIKQIFEDSKSDRIFSDSLVKTLRSIEDHPWADWNHGKGLNQNGLSRLLSPFGISSKNLRIGNELRRGYEKNSFGDAFKRYLPLIPPDQSVTTSQVNKINMLDNFQSVTTPDYVTDVKKANMLKKLNGYVVTDEKRVSWKRKAEEVF